MELVLSGFFGSRWPAIEHLFSTGGAIVTRCGGTPAEVMTYCGRVSPCVLIVNDMFFQDLDIDTFCYAVESERAIHVLVALEEDDDFRCERLIRMGCAGILNREMNEQQVLHALEVVAAGELWLSRKQLGSIIRKMLIESRHRLTLRESQVLNLVSEGLKNSEIADRLFVSPETIRWHLRSLYKKMGTHDRFRIAIHSRLIQEPASPSICQS